MFGGHKSSGSSSGSNSSGSQSQLDWRNDSTVYAPGEQMPRPKYRLPVNKQHKQLLDRYTWADNLFHGTRSRDSLFSPGGTRMPSRNPSRTSSRAVSRRSSVDSLRSRPILQHRGRSEWESSNNLLEDDTVDLSQPANVTLASSTLASSRPHSPSGQRRTGPRRHVHLSERAQASVQRAANRGRDSRHSPHPASDKQQATVGATAPALSSDDSTDLETPLSPATPPPERSELDSALHRTHTAADHKAMSEEEIQEALSKLTSKLNGGALLSSKKHVA